MAEAIYINTAIDVDYKPAFDKIGKIEHRLDQLTRQRDIEVNVRMEKLQTDLYDIDEQISEQQFIQSHTTNIKLLEQTEAELDRLQRKRQTILGQIDAENNKIDNINWQIAQQNDLVKQTTREQEEQARAAEEQARAAREQASAYNQVQTRLKESSGFMDQLSRRLTGLLKRVFVFSLITQGLRAIRSWFSAVLQQNSEAVYAIRLLKGALLTLIQPIIQYVIPIAVKLIKVLTMITLKIAQFIASIFGKTLKQSAVDASSLYQSMNKTSGTSAKVAKNTKKQAKNAKDTADAMAEAEGSLASFDKLNVIDSDNGTDAALEPDIDLEDPIDDAIDDIGEIDMSPLFDFDDIGLDDELETIYNWVVAILAAIAGFQLLKWLTKLTGSLKSAIGIIMAVAGAFMFVKTYIDAWKNGITFDNLLEMLGWLTLAVVGLGLAFGPVGAAIGMVVGGLALLVLGVKDMWANGFTYENFATVAAGLMLIGGAFALLTGSWIPLLIAAFVALTILVVAKWQEIKEWAIDTFSGIWDFLKGLWTTIKAVVKGWFAVIKAIFTGTKDDIANAFALLWGGIVNGFRQAVNGMIRFLNGLINGLNTILWPIRKVVTVVAKVLGASWTMEDIRIPNIPALASGTVVPPNHEFLARLGDNKTEPEIVSPLSTMQQAFANTLASSGLIGAIERDTAVQADLLETLITLVKNKQLVISPSANLGRVISKSTTLYKGVTG